MNLRSTVFLFLILTGCTFPLRAVEFRLISWEGEIQGLQYADGKAKVAIDASEGALSSAYRFEGAGPLVLFREVKVDDKIVRIPVATLTIPSGLTQAIILLSYADATRTTYTGKWINDSVDVRPPQTVTYRNFSSYTVAIKMGTAEHVLPANEGLTLATGSTVERVLFKAAAQTQSGWQVVASTVQPVRPGLRTLVIMRNGRPDYTGHKEIIDLLMFNDYPPPPTPPGTPLASR
ncbi:MAG: hypothetical protein WC661_15055 [Opitutaceae bacterium]|jgi:hypothetical protein